MSLIFFCGLLVFLFQATCNLQVPSCGCSQNAASWCITKIHSYITNTLIPIFLHIQIHIYSSFYTKKYTQNFLHILTFRKGRSTNCTFCCEDILVVTSSPRNEIHSHLVYSKLRKLHSNFGFQNCIFLSMYPPVTHILSTTSVDAQKIRGKNIFQSLQQCIAL